MEIQENEYVRTNNGQIFKVLEVEKGSVKIKSDYREWIGICCLIKHSFKIKDLVEADDFVNDYKVYKENGKLAIEMCEHMPPYKYIEDIDIYSIVTKEMYESIKYEV